MEEKKISYYDTVTDHYYRFYYGNGYIVAKCKRGALCHYAVRSSELYKGDSDALWLKECGFGASKYCTPASEDEIAWLEFCVKRGSYLSKETFLREHYIQSGERYDYQIF